MMIQMEVVTRIDNINTGPAHILGTNGGESTDTEKNTQKGTCAFTKESGDNIPPDCHVRNSRTVTFSKEDEQVNMDSQLSNVDWLNDLEVAATLIKDAQSGKNMFFKIDSKSLK